MNPVLKERVYRLGTQEQVDWLKWFSGMNEEESEMYQMYHDGRNDLDVEQALSITKSTRADMEDLVAKKLAFGLIICADREMQRHPKPN